MPKALSCKRRVIITYDEEKTIEDEYGIEIPDEEAEAFQSISDIVKYVEDNA